MPARDYRDVIGGAALVVAGAFIAHYSIMFLSLGTISNMGPGMFPAALGCILVVLGFAISVPALYRAGPLPDIDFRSFMAISLSVFAFALMLRPFGLIPAIMALTLIASRADSKLTALGTLMLAVGLSVTAMLIFRVGLGMQVAAIRWPG